MIKNLPASETKTPGVLCKTRTGAEYIITGNEYRSKFTLWEKEAGGYEKVTTGKSPTALYGKIPW